MDEIVTIAVNAEDDNGIHTVEVLIDGQPFTRDDMPPYIVHWDSRGAANGLHEIRAKAVDTMGQWRGAV
ncbi:MAG: Ig-like domain-containing protein [Caldilineaceae bacterium]